MNAKVNVIFYVVSLVLAFFSRKVFLDNLGTEFMGLSGALGDMLNLMNITELGIGTAVGVTLYKPIFEKDREKINDIVSVYGFLYTRVGTLIATAGVILSLFFPLIFRNAGLPLYLPYLMFFSMLYASLLGYFVNYREILFGASQRNYVTTICYQITITIKIILQILVSFLPYGYIWWILLEAVTITIYTIILNKTIDKYFPWLDTSIDRGRVRFKDYRNLWTKTKQVFVLKLSNLVFVSSTNVLTAAFANLTMVAMFGNYNIIMLKVTTFIDGIFTGMGASVGNLLSEGDMDKIMKVFYELLSVRYFLAAFCSITLYFTVSPFISVWLGNQYIMSKLIIVLLSLHIFIQQARITVDNFKNGYGLYQDVWAPIVEVLLYLGIAIALGFKFGLVGILTGMVVSETLIKMLWKPYFLFKEGFKISVWKQYWPVLIKYIFIILLCLFVCRSVSSWYLSSLKVTGWLPVIIYCAIMAMVVGVVLFLLFAVSDKNFVGFVKHLIQYKKR